MADKSDQTGGVRTSINRADTKKLLTKLADIRAKQSEITGSLGAETNAACDKHGLDKNSLTVVRRMHGMTETKAHSFLYGVIDLAWKGGLFDQVDAFDAMTDLLSEILEELKRNQQPAPSAEDAEALSTLQ